MCLTRLPIKVAHFSTMPYHASMSSKQMLELLVEFNLIISGCHMTCSDFKHLLWVYNVHGRASLSNSTVLPKHFGIPMNRTHTPVTSILSFTPLMKMASWALSVLSSNTTEIVVKLWALSCNCSETLCERPSMCSASVPQQNKVVKQAVLLGHRTSVTMRPMLCSEKENNKKLKDFYVLGKPAGGSQHMKCVYW